MHKNDKILPLIMKVREKAPNLSKDSSLFLGISKSIFSEDGMLKKESLKLNKVLSPGTIFILNFRGHGW